MRILLIEDDIHLCDSLSFELKKEGYETDCCHTGGDVFYYMNEGVYDIILLDRMLPETDGLTILKIIRQKGISTPVIFLTALGQLSDKIQGLNMGADDYLVKPFAFEELLARIQCIARRPQKWEDKHMLIWEDLTFDAQNKTLTGPLGSCNLSKRESTLFEFLFQNKNITLPRSVLLAKVWGIDCEVEDGNLDNYIHFIRRRLKAIGSIISLQTIRSVGYKLTGGCD